MITILMPVFNCEKYIADSLRSILNQDIARPMKIIVVDDGSTDRTRACIDELNAPQISVRTTENQGVTITRNALLGLIPGEAEYVAFFDADDLMPAGRLRRDIEILERDPDLALVYGCMAFFDGSDHSGTDRPRDITQVVRSANLNVATFRKTSLLNNGGLDESFVQAEDLDFLLRFFERSPRVQLLNEISMYYRQHATNMTHDKAVLRRGIMKAMLNHAQRLRKDPTRVSVKGVFDSQPLSQLGGETPESATKAP